MGKIGKQTSYKTNLIQSDNLNDHSAHSAV